MISCWAQRAAPVLAELFAPGKTPTRQDIIDAYPFGERKYWPYMVWLREVRRWKHARRLGMTTPYSLRGVNLDGFKIGHQGYTLAVLERSKAP